MVDPQEFLDFYLDSQFEDIAGWKPLPRARMIKQAGRTMNSKRTRGKAFDAMDRLGDNSGTRMRREFGVQANIGKPYEQHAVSQCS